MTREEIHLQNILSIEETAARLLLETGDIGKITVSGLCKEAGVSRQTFYKNYDGIEDVLRRYVRKDFQEIFECFSHWFHNDKTKEAMADLLRAFKERKDLYTILFLRNDSMILHQFESFVDEMDIPDVHLNTFEKDYFTGAFFEVIKQWILRDCKDPVEEIAAFLEGRV